MGRGEGEGKNRDRKKEKKEAFLYFSPPLPSGRPAAQVRIKKWINSCDALQFTEKCIQ